jgi:hypothetical protein
MKVFTFGIVPHLENERVQPGAYPADSTELFGDIGSLIEVVGMREDLLGFLESDAALRVGPEFLAFPCVELEAHGWSITLIPQKFDLEKGKNGGVGLTIPAAGHRMQRNVVAWRNEPMNIHLR